MNVHNFTTSWRDGLAFNAIIHKHRWGGGAWRWRRGAGAVGHTVTSVRDAGCGDVRCGMRDVGRSTRGAGWGCGARGEPWGRDCGAEVLLLLRPDLVDMDALRRCNAHYNLQSAFNLAERELGLTKLLDPEGMEEPGDRGGVWGVRGAVGGLQEPATLTPHTLLPADVNVDQPDEKSIITYVATFYHYFSKMKALAVEGKRIGKVTGQRGLVDGRTDRQMDRWRAGGKERGAER